MKHTVSAILLILASLQLGACGDDDTGTGTGSTDTGTSTDLTYSPDTGGAQDSGSGDVGGQDTTQETSQDSGAEDLADAGSEDLPPDTANDTGSQGGEDASDMADVAQDTGSVDIATEPEMEPPPTSFDVAVLDADGEAVAGVPVQFDPRSDELDAVVLDTGDDGVATFEDVTGFGSVTTIVEDAQGHRDILTMFGVGAGDSVTLAPPFEPVRQGVIGFPICNGIIGSIEFRDDIDVPALLLDEGSTVRCDDATPCQAVHDEGYCNVAGVGRLPVPGGLVNTCYRDHAPADYQADSTCDAAFCITSLKGTSTDTRSLCVCGACTESLDDQVLVAVWAKDADGNGIAFTSEAGPYTAGSTTLIADAWSRTPVTLSGISFTVMAESLETFGVNSAAFRLISSVGSVGHSFPQQEVITDLAPYMHFSVFAPLDAFDTVWARLSLQYRTMDAPGGEILFERAGAPEEDYAIELGLRDPRLAQINVTDFYNANDAGGFQPAIDFLSDRAPTGADVARLQVTWVETSEEACSFDNLTCITANSTCNVFASLCDEPVEWHVVGPPGAISDGENSIVLPALGEELSALYTLSDGVGEPTVREFFIYGTDFINGFAGFKESFGLGEVELPESYTLIRSAPFFD